MNWPSSTQQDTNPFAGFFVGKLDQHRVLILITLLFIPGFGWVGFQPENRGNAWLFGLLTASVVIKLARLLHGWYHYRNMMLPQQSPVTHSGTVYGLTTCPAVSGGLTWRQRLHYFTLPFYYLPGVVLPGNSPVRLVHGAAAEPGVSRNQTYSID